MEIEEVVGLDSSENARNPRRGGGISPLPEIRAVVVADHQVSPHFSFYACLCMENCNVLYYEKLHLKSRLKEYYASFI